MKVIKKSLKFKPKFKEGVQMHSNIRGASNMYWISFGAIKGNETSYLQRVKTSPEGAELKREFCK